MKAFQTLLFLVIVILIGGMAALYWGKSIENATAPVVIEESVPEPVEEGLSTGSYLVFQSEEVTDPGTQDWANDDTETYTFYRLKIDDIGSSEPVEFAAVEHPATVEGGLTTYIFGQYLQMHRYQKENQDGILSLEGEVVETSEEQWTRFRSANGAYEVRYEFGPDTEDAGTIEVVEVETGNVLAQFDLILDSGEVGNPEPFLIDDEGTFVYARQVCGCEATLSGFWVIDVGSGEVTRLDTLVDLDSWFLSSLDADGRRMVTLSTDRQPSKDGPYYELLPPTTIRILDLDTLEPRELLVDEARAWDRPWLDPEGKDRYIVRDEEDKEYLVDFDDTEITEEQYLTDGWVLDWVGDWLVMQDMVDLTLKLVNVESKEEVNLEIPGEQAEYVGSIELN